MKTLLFTESAALCVATTVIAAAAAALFSKHSIPIVAFYVFLMASLMYFYRYPTLAFHPNPKALMAPSDGVVKKIVYDKENERIKVIVFLNIFNQHLQFYPVNGIIANTTYHKGSFHPAYFLEKSAYNERMVTSIKTDKDTIIVTQIAGQIARRIVNHAKLNAAVRQGDYMGMIKLSSRVDIEFSSKIYACKVAIGDKLTALEKIIAVEK